jgi:diacylglycerol O-acyltransferase / wax synthase
MRVVNSIDLDHHVRCWTLPRPGGERELGELVSRLHCQRLRMDRPLWELHLIDSLQHDRFALLLKFHHSIFDGHSAMRRVTDWLSPDPDHRGGRPLFSIGPRVRTANGRRRELALPTAAAVTRPLRAGGELTRMFIELSRGKVDGRRLAAPYRLPALFRGPINGRRRVATQRFDLAALKRLAKAHDATLNDIVLWLSSTALRTYLVEQGTVPDAALTAGAPMSLRGPDDHQVGTAIGMLPIDLATNIEDPVERLEAIKLSAAAAKRHVRKLSGDTRALQTAIAHGPVFAGLAFGLGGFTPAAFNIVISNVKGPSEQLYLEGAAVDVMVPVSLVIDNNPLNITCVSHGDTLSFGVVGATATVPRLQRIATAMAEALDELEAATAAPIDREIASHA